MSGNEEAIRSDATMYDDPFPTVDDLAAARDGQATLEHTETSEGFRGLPGQSPLGGDDDV